MRSVKDEWQEYALAVIPVDAPREQRTEMRRAFYAGMIAAIFLLDEASADGINVDEGVQHLTRIKDELMQFNEDVKAGRA